MTAFRVKVLSVFIDSGERALSNAAVEDALKDFDRITLYRTLKTFEKHGLIHQAIDGSNENKYAYCHNDCDIHAHDDNHMHFNCNNCGETFCLETATPIFQLPNGYTMDQIHIAVSGTCAGCN